MPFFRGVPNKVIVKNDKTLEYIEHLREDTSKNKLAATAARSEIARLNDEIALLSKQQDDSRLKLEAINRATEDQERQFTQAAQRYILNTNKAKHEIEHLKQDIADLERSRDAAIAETATLTSEINALSGVRDSQAAAIAAEHKTQSEAFTEALRAKEMQLAATDVETIEASKRLLSVNHETNESIKLLNETNESIKRAELLLSLCRAEMAAAEQRAESINTMIDENNTLRETINNDKLENTRRAKELATWSGELKVEADLLKTKTAALIKREQTVREAMERLSK